MWPLMKLVAFLNVLGIMFGICGIVLFGWDYHMLRTSDEQVAIELAHAQGTSIPKVNRNDVGFINLTGIVLFAGSVLVAGSTLIVAYRLREKRID